MNFRDGSGKLPKALVSLAANLLSWQPRKGYFYGQIRIAAGYDIAYDVMDNVTSPVAGGMTL